MQMVERYDRGVLPRQDFSDSYSSLYKLVQKALFRTHVEGQLKADIIQDPASYVELDPDMCKTLLDQRAAVSMLNWRLCTCAKINVLQWLWKRMFQKCTDRFLALHYCCVSMISVQTTFQELVRTLCKWRHL